MNHVTLIGRIVRNLELRTTASGKSYVFFSVAVSDPMRKDHTDFISCVSWNKTAENMVRFVGKGSLISVMGRISTRKDNKDQYITEIVANNVTFLDSRKKDSVSTDNNDSDLNNKTTKVNIDEAFKNTNEYDTEIDFINNKSVEPDLDDNDDEAIIWD